MVESEPYNSNDSPYETEQRLSNEIDQTINVDRSIRVSNSFDHSSVSLPESLIVEHEAKPDPSIVENDLNSSQPVLNPKTNAFHSQGRDFSIIVYDWFKVLANYFNV